MVVGLDIGTSMVRVAMGNVLEDGTVEIIATSAKPSAGLRNGAIVNIEDASAAIKSAIEDAELKTGIEVSSCVTAIGGTQIEGRNQSGNTPVTAPGKNTKEIEEADIQRAIDNAKAVLIPMDRELLHVVARSFTVDGASGIPNPLNMIAARLEANVHVITASRTTIQNVNACVSRAGYIANGIMLKTLAATQAVMHQDEMEMGSILIDMGAGTTDVLVLLDGAPVCTVSVPVGGNMVTQDISIVKGIPLAEAEKIKVENGCCWFQLIENDSDIIIPGVGGRDPDVMTRTELCQIILPRVAETFLMVRSAVMKSDSALKRLDGNIILTGGGALMPGAVELASQVFGTSSVRLGIPEKMGQATDEYRNPAFATAVGLVLANKAQEGVYEGKKRKLFTGNEEHEKNNAIKKILRLFF